MLTDFGATDLKFKSYPMECDKKKHRILSAPLSRFLSSQGQVAGLRALAENDATVLGLKQRCSRHSRHFLPDTILPSPV